MARVGNEIAMIAHPLTRVRLVLERGRAMPTIGGCKLVTDRAIDDVDHALTIITTLCASRRSISRPSRIWRMSGW
jgi:hypothetical protein